MSDPEIFMDPEFSAAELAAYRRRKNARRDDKTLEAVILPPEASEDRLALLFAERHSDLRYVAGWSKWLQWTGTHWKFDDTYLSFDLARAICREAAAKLGPKKEKIASAISSAKVVAAVITLARADRRIAATVDQWDADPWMLNTPGGVVDLRTGEERAPRIDDYATKITGTWMDRDCPTPHWAAFLSKVTDGDAALQMFLRRMVGYSLSGITIEHALFFLFGTGANGKSVFLSTIYRALGGYAKTAPIETFTVSHGDRHPTELAGLRGARLVTAIETEHGRKWAESRIKTLTGGDVIAARFMRQDFFEYLPQFKLVIAGNHKPGLSSVDEAIKRRFHLVPFDVTIPPQERNPALPELLKAELPGILWWAVEGCLDWQRRGLEPPEAVMRATADYLQAEDARQLWMDECCFQREPDSWAKSSDLYVSWNHWAERAGELAGTQKAFSQALEDRGFTKEHRRTGNGFQGLRLIPQMTVDER